MSDDSHPKLIRTEATWALVGMTLFDLQQLFDLLSVGMQDPDAGWLFGLSGQGWRDVVGEIERTVWPAETMAEGAEFGLSDGFDRN